MTTQIEPAAVAASDPPVDQRVLDVQEWLNEYYRQAAGAQWIEVPETGRTGWSTMYGLTRALQHELGIATLSNNFGDGTLAALTTQFPTINSSTTSSNPAKLARIVKIIQGGLYCKGYNPNGLDGGYGPGCTSAVASLRADMGLTAVGTIIPKVFKGLLTMDAYVLLPGGTSAARTVQQWLNATYLARQNFFVMPCDGLYSRNTQKALVYALQYEIGMTDATANGNFGPGTRDGVRDNGTFNQGAQDSGGSQWVRLFHGALIFNKYQVPFDSNFSASDSAVVESFQDFCKLEVNGNADYPTWCSLLVSNGDPTRLGTACDTRVQITPTFGSILSNLGYETIGRYLTNARVANPLDKEIKPGELNTIFNAGLSVYPIYQEVGSSVANFTFGKGFEAGLRADSAAEGHGIPPGTTVYFAVDFDPTDDQISAAVLPHFRGVAAALESRGGRYTAGVYGTRNVCQTVTDAGLAAYSFVAGMSTGFSGNLGYTLPTNWAFDQIYEYTVTTGLPLDKNIKSGRDHGFDHTVAVNTPGNADFIAYINWLEMAAADYLSTHVSSRSAARLVCQYVRRLQYDDVNFDALVDVIDDDWTAYVDTRRANENVSEVPIYSDPSQDGVVLGSPFDAAHLFVAIEGYLARAAVPSASATAHISDIPSWAGDLASVISSYYRHANPNESALDFYRRFIGAPTTNSDTLFGITDLCQDADSVNIASDVLANTGETFAAIVARHLTYGGPSATTNRFSAFRTRRFGTQANLLAAANYLFTNMRSGAPEQSTLAVATYALVLSEGEPKVLPELVPMSTYEAAAQAFAEKIASHAS
ncbi:glycoside hydrolase domain-containing protein [Cellulosimicrobium cellulans]